MLETKLKLAGRSALRARQPAVLIALALLAVALIGAPAAAAQALAFEIAWWTVDGGGGLSAGGSYSLDGTLGQPDAGALAGGAYSLSGGFWDQGADALPWGGSLYLPMVQKGACTSAPTEQEPNNYVSEANWLCLGSPVAGSHDGAASTGDLFKLSLAASQVIAVDLDTTNADGVQMLLYRQELDGSLALLVQDAGPPFAFEHTVETSGTYLIYVYSDPAYANLGSYTLRVSRLAQQGDVVPAPASQVTPPAPPAGR